MHQKYKKMISKEDYQLMKKIVKDYESGAKIDTKSAYLVTYSVDINKEYNPNFGDDRECQCGHSYYRHFDPYEQMDACGCKYCSCYDFKLAQSEIREDKLNSIL